LTTIYQATVNNAKKSNFTWKVLLLYRMSTVTTKLGHYQTAEQGNVVKKLLIHLHPSNYKQTKVPAGSDLRRQHNQVVMG
jgi:hypothetical protein